VHDSNDLPGGSFGTPRGDNNEEKEKAENEYGEERMKKEKNKKEKKRKKKYERHCRVVALLLLSGKVANRLP
jgi:hypothetical protein